MRYVRAFVCAEFASVYERDAIAVRPEQLVPEAVHA